MPIEKSVQLQKNDDDRRNTECAHTRLSPEIFPWPVQARVAKLQVQKATVLQQLQHQAEEIVEHLLQIQRMRVASEKVDTRQAHHFDHEKVIGSVDVNSRQQNA
jgi:hypothetical protein